MTPEAQIRTMHAAGWALIPLCPPSCSCNSPGKVPHQSGWEHALFDVDELVAWHADGGNIGWRMGPQGDGTGPFLVALDVDDAAALADFEAREDAELPTETRAQATPRPGTHYIWRWPDSVPPPPNAARKQAIPGVDIRSAGGQIAVCPSRHVNGGVYAWENALDIATLPEGWAQFISDFYHRSEPVVAAANGAVSPSAPLPATLDGLASAVRNAPNGGQRDALNTAAYTAGGLVATGRLDREAATAALEEAASEWEDFDPRRPWTPGQIEEIVRAGIADGMAAPIAGRAKPLELPPPAIPPPAADPWGALGRRLELDARRLSAPVWICEGLGLAVDSKPAMVAARAGEGKSPFAAALAVAVAKGRPFLGLPVRQGPVVVLAAEGALALQRRLVSLAGGTDAPIDFVEVSPVDVATAEWRDRVLAALDAAPPALVVLDTYTSAAMGLGAEHGSPEYAALALWLGAECARRGAGCVLTVHIGKSRKADERPSMHDVAGTFMLGGSAHSIVILHRPDPDSDPDRVEVSCGRALGNPFAPFEARWVGNAMLADPVEDPLRLERLGFTEAKEPARVAVPSLERRALLALALEKLVENGEFRAQRVGLVMQSAGKLWAAACRATGARFGNDAWGRCKTELEQLNHLVVGTDAIGVRDPEAARAFAEELKR